MNNASATSSDNVELLETYIACLRVWRDVASRPCRSTEREIERTRRLIAHLRRNRTPIT